jgi:predicted nucleotidyltransferase
MRQVAEPFSKSADGLYVSPEEMGIIAGMLRKHVAGRRVWAFGSRATGRRLKRFSDLDLALEGTLTWEERTALEADFDESLLPFKVDVVELEKVDPGFRERIEGDFVALHLGD